MSRLEALTYLCRVRPLTDDELDDLERLTKLERRANIRRNLYANDQIWRLTKLKAQREYWRRNAVAIAERRRARYAADPEYRARRLATDGKACR